MSARLRATAQDLLDLRLKQSFFLMVMCNLLQNLRVLQLRLKNILLIALAHPVARFRRPAESDLVSGRFVPGLGRSAEGRRAENRFILRFPTRRSADRIGLRLDRVGFSLGNLGSQTAFTWIGDILRRSDAHVGEVAIAVACERPWTPHAELLHSELGVR